VPRGYAWPPIIPTQRPSRAKIEVGNVGKARLYYSSVDKKEDGLYLSSSGAIGIVGFADTWMPPASSPKRALGRLKVPFPSAKTSEHRR